MKVLIVGSMHVGNIGDNLLGAVLREVIREILPTADVSVVNTSNIELVDEADVVIVGPGGLIDDVVVQNVENYLSFLRRAQDKGIVNMMVGVGVQRLKSSTGKRLCREILNKTDYLSVRSKEDAEILKSIGVVVPVYALQDMAFLLHDRKMVQTLVRRADRNSYTNKLKQLLLTSRKPKLGFSLMNWDFQHVDRNKIQPGMVQIAKRYTEYIQNNMDKLVKEFEVFLICQSADDASLYERLAQGEHIKMINLHTVPLDRSIELYDVYNNLDYVMTGRFHGLIMAMITGKPLMNISIGNHKQAKLIEHDQPSLRAVNYRLEDLYEQDLFTKFIDMYKEESLPSSSWEETRRCARLVGINAALIEYQLLRAFKLAA